MTTLYRGTRKHFERNDNTAQRHAKALKRDNTAQRHFERDDNTVQRHARELTRRCRVFTGERADIQRKGQQ
jgi:hypothetical protein